ncbi:tetratricopeptide repeat protein [Nocardia vaccinii]|uniref:tetratricopeptide repeat protein n=1 Tax=Nocardia vaccinii TaxID=1822 RepID=UPI000AC36C22|nr:tetratricopeptide repeat protein [Nocardia vaccinii]
MTDDRIAVTETIPLPDVLRALTRELTAMTGDRAGGYEPRAAELTVRLLIDTDAGEPRFHVVGPQVPESAGTTTHTLKLTLQPLLGDPTQGEFAPVPGSEPQAGKSVGALSISLADTFAQSAEPLRDDVPEPAHIFEPESAEPKQNTDAADFEHTVGSPGSDPAPVATARDTDSALTASGEAAPASRTQVQAAVADDPEALGDIDSGAAIGTADDAASPTPSDAEESGPAGETARATIAQLETPYGEAHSGAAAPEPHPVTTAEPIAESAHADTVRTETPHNDADSTAASAAGSRRPSGIDAEAGAAASDTAPPASASADANSEPLGIVDGTVADPEKPLAVVADGPTPDTDRTETTPFGTSSGDTDSEPVDTPAAESPLSSEPIDDEPVRTGTTESPVAGESTAPEDNPTAPIPRTSGEANAESEPARNVTASAYSDLDDEHAEVIARYEKILVDRERAMGPLHRHTLISAGNLARAYREAGRSSQAIDVYERVLTDSENTFGPQDLDTLIFRGSLARCYREAGRMVEAIDLYERTLTDSEQGFGPDHKNTLTARHNLALAYREDGRLDDAIELYRICLADSERLLGSNHRDTLITCDSLASCLREAGKVAKATALDERLLTARRRVLGPEHPDTLHSTVNLASDRAAANRANEAADLYEQALSTSERVLGPDHPISERARIGLAHGYAEVGRASEAADLFERLLADCERQLGPDHRHTLIARNNLAVAYHDAGRFAEAIEAHTRTAEDRERLLGPDHPDTLKSREHLAYSYEAELLARTSGPQIAVPQE